MDTRQATRAGNSWWLTYLGVGVVVIVAYYVAVHLNAPALLRVVLYCLASASAAIAVLVGCLRQPAEPPIAAALADPRRQPGRLRDRGHLLLRRARHPR